MSKKCAKCTKSVYPTEELKCLDKIWHKACFKCETCGMTLNMKNYKGYEKLPYCSAHYPQTKHTQVADTPETRRIAENTKIQSNVQYHADFEKLKGQKTSVAEDPELARIKHNTAIQSNINYWGVREQRTAMEERRPEAPDDGTRHRSISSKIGDFDQPQVQYNSPYSGKTHANVVYDSHTGEGLQFSGDAFQGSGRRQPGSIENYDPMSQQYGSGIGVPTGFHHPEPVRQAPYQPQPPQSYSEPQPPKQANKGMVCRALYDYSAADTDEVSFMDGDLIIQCHPIDAGWMEGTVERTGKRGMLPSNYVERI
ncbi:LIM and SH3 domain protein F42H10.3-like isoform X2 [Pomacea canaliculata]|uniref:LIM and SH3 domain protein F42H10.3-like isoform X2 n=1 Tax=Pomacea canaliculata TaxID=400727 RepID=UPI000D732805|nr:LIM and SH3 domain protein F42H10.3-like isoform X2 [Pomacea canaliculata]